MSRKGLRTILIGFGQIAAGLGHDAKMASHFTYATHAQVLRDHPGFDWLGVVDPDEQAQRRARDEWQVPHVGGDLSAVARHVKPEVAVIAAPPGRARADTVQQLPDLKAVLVEKPLGVGGTEGEAFIHFCRKRDVKVMVNYWRRGDELYRSLAAGGLNDRIGRPQAVFGTYGNGLFNNGGHLVDFVQMLLGEVASVQGLDHPIQAENTSLAEDWQATFALTLVNGTVVTVRPLDFHFYREVGLDIWGEHGRLAFYQEGLGVFHYPLADNRGLENAMEIASDKPTVLTPTVGSALYNLYDNLADVIAGKAEPFSPGEKALFTEQVLNAVLASAAENGTRLHFQ
jgi:predicted dehydrogenase